MDHGSLVKYVDFEPYDRRGEPLVYVAPDDRDIDKLAGADLHPEVLAFLDATKPPDDHIRLIPAAVGVYDYYGPNVNGDGFYEQDMLRIPQNVFYLDDPEKAYDQPTYKTFATHANLFMKHMNRADSPRYGAIPHSVFNDRMHRIELVVDIDRNRAIGVTDDIDRGILPGFSMGFRCIPADRCSVCGNEARSRSEYCSHLSRMLGRVLEGDMAKQAGVEDGHIVHARNPNGYFFDFSIVDRPADHIAHGMKKVAGLFQGVDFSSHRQMEKNAETLLDEIADKYAGQNKSADIIKEVPMVPTAKESVETMEEKAPRFTRIVLRFKPQQMDLGTLMGMSDRYPLHTISATLGQKGVALTPMEFQTMALNQMGHPQCAKLAYEQGAVFSDEIDISDVTPVVNDYLDPHHEIVPSQKLAAILDHELGDLMRERDVRPSAMVKRIISVDKEAAEVPVGPFTLGYPAAPVKSPMPGALTNILVQSAPSQSMGNTSPYISAQPVGTTIKSDNNPVVPLAVLAGMFIASNYIASKSSILRDKGFLWKVPLAAGAGLAATLGISNAGLPQGPIKQGGVANLADDLVVQTMLGVGASYGMARRSEKKRARGIQPNMAEQAAEKNPLLLGLIGAASLRGAIYGAKKLLSKTGELRPEYVDMYDEAILVDIIEGR